MKRQQTLLAYGSAFVAGALFALGLVLAGMTQPSKVLGFLDVFGDWDPSLVWVMAGAVGVNAAVTWRILKREAPHFLPRFVVPAVTRERWTSQINVPLVLGAVLFGAGWGLSGYCPGPAIVSVPSVLGGGAIAGVFFVSMVFGMLLFSAYSRYRPHRSRAAVTEERTQG